MPLTDNCDVFGAVHEDGINAIARHITRQRPSLFNYGTRFFQLRPERLCHKIDAHPEVIRRSNPLITVEDPLPIPGTNGMYGLDFCVQLTKLMIDFHPGNVIALPPELAPLCRQRLALVVEACAGILCPDRKVVDAVGDDIASQTPPRKDDKDQRDPRETPKLPPRPLPGEEVHCFCLGVFAVAHAERLIVGGREFIVVRLDGLEIVDIKPDGLESAPSNATSPRSSGWRSCRSSESRSIRWSWTSAISQLTIGPTPISAAVPNNPAVEDDQLKVFANYRGGHGTFHRSGFGRHVPAVVQDGPRQDPRLDQRQRGSRPVQPLLGRRLPARRRHRRSAG